ncbi:DUF2809 domain-containing protein [Naasia sp. SYSU D00057]|uniref:ribosomal maturation YjgA family protein n=1 Tax=Naasia sp. SYSU D00057 TaxID=2817380 RepID=UPI001B30D96F|nr:DUF2809 domain-containing protein [Naasia sp. SYSU D00057]
MAEAAPPEPDDVLERDTAAAVRPARARVRIVAAAVLVIAAGLLVHSTVPGLPGDVTADALYALLAYLVAAFLLPRGPALVLAALALALCCLIEVWQLTGTPAALVDVFPPARLLVGTTFSALDLAAYAAGVLVGVLADRALTGATPPPPPR